MIGPGRSCPRCHASATGDQEYCTPRMRRAAQAAAAAIDRVPAAPAAQRPGSAPRSSRSSSPHSGDGRDRAVDQPRGALRRCSVDRWQPHGRRARTGADRARADRVQAGDDDASPGRHPRRRRIPPRSLGRGRSAAGRSCSCRCRRRPSARGRRATRAARVACAASACWTRHVSQACTGLLRGLHGHLRHPGRGGQRTQRAGGRARRLRNEIVP